MKKTFHIKKNHDEDEEVRSKPFNDFVIMQTGCACLYDDSFDDMDTDEHDEDWV